MPDSRFIRAEQLKPLLVYFAVAFVVVLVVGTMVPEGRLRNVLALAWVVLFPVGGWLVFRRG